MPLFRGFTQNLKNPSEKESSTTHFFSYPPSLPLAICLYSCYPFIIYFSWRWLMNLSTLIKYQALMLLTQGLLYFGSEIFQKNPHDISTDFDQKIPVIPLFTYIYILWFPVIALFPIHLYQTSPPLYKAYMVTWMIELGISTIIYMAYPTSFTRPRNVKDYPGGWLLKIVYHFSYKGLNCMPSMHCSMCAMVLFFTFLAPGLALPLKLIYTLLPLGILLSTVFTKQHVILDLVTGVLLGILSSLLALAIL